MLLTLYDKNYNQKMEIAPSDSSTQQKEVQSDSVLSLSFTSFECVTFDVGDYIDFCGARFWVTDKYTPKQISSVEWEYSVSLYGIESMIKRFLVIKLVNGDNETEFSYTATAYDQVALIVQNINAGMETSDWKVGEVVSSEYIVMDYEGTYCDEGLATLADKCGVEYWIDGTTVNLCRCEHSASITLGYDNGLTNIYKDKANNVKFFTRLFPIGTTRNIVNDDYGHSRLQLPNGVKYLDQDVDKFGVVHHYEKEAFAHIYPRRVGTISSVRSEEVTGEDGNPFTIYYFKDASLNFDPNDYEIGGLVKTISFQDGSDLAGRDFEVNFNSTTKEFEIITQWPYDNDIQLPNEQLCLKIGDKYILWNVKMPIEYYALAEAEYKTAVDEYMADQRKDVTVYKAHTDYIDIDERGLNLTLGQRVRLEHAEYFEDGYRDSRITKITRKVVRPTEMDIEISDVLSKGALEKVNDSITDVKNYTKIATGGFPSIIKSWDNTLPTDSNVFSARKALQESLSRQVDDVAKGLITFLKGIKLGDYVAGESGSVVDAGGNAEFQTAVIRELLRSTKFVDGMMGEGYKMWIDAITGLSNLTIDKVTIRQSLVAMELLIEKVRSVGGQFVVSAANGKIKSVVESGDNYIISFEQENTFEEHDLMRCATFSGEIKGYWVEVLESTANSITVPISEFEGGDPVMGDECVLMGNTENALRQNLILIAATEDGQPRIDILDGVNAKNFNGCMRVRLGALDGVNDPTFPLDNQPQGYGLYSDNAYLKGTFVLSTGEDILTRFSVVEGKVESAIEGLKQDFTADKSFLDNATFGDGLTSWETENEATLFRFGGKWLWINDAPYSTKSDYAAVKQDDGRTTVFIKNNYILQKNENFRTIPTYTDTNSDGQKIAEAIYLLFFYRVKKAGRLTIEFDGLDQTGFEPFNAFSYLEDMEVTDGSYKTFNHSGLWNGTGDFKLSFTGEMNLYMLVLSTDKADALAWKYKTLFEQSEKLIKIAAQNFDVNGDILESSSIVTTSKYNQLISERFNTDGSLKNKSGLVTTTSFADYKQQVEDAGYLDASGVLSKIQSKIDDGTIMKVSSFTGMFATAVNSNGLVKSADIAAFITEDDVGDIVSNIEISADQINLEGVVTANDNFKILEDGSIEAKNGKFIGEIESNIGHIGGFEIGNGRIGSEASSGGSGGSLAIYQDFFRVGGDNGYVMFGNDVIPSSLGGAITATGRVYNNHSNDNEYFGGSNYGLHIDVTGGARNYGLWSNAALMAPAFINTKIKELTFSGDSYKMDFAQHTIFLMKSSSWVSVTLPTEYSVCDMFGYSSLPSDFGAILILKVRTGSQKITIKGIYDVDEHSIDHDMLGGDALTLLVSKMDGFRYNILNASY